MPSRDNSREPGRKRAQKGNMPPHLNYNSYKAKEYLRESFRQSQSALGHTDISSMASV